MARDVDCTEMHDCSEFMIIVGGIFLVIGFFGEGFRDKKGTGVPIVFFVGFGMMLLGFLFECIAHCAEGNRANATGTVDVVLNIGSNTKEESVDKSPPKEESVDKSPPKEESVDKSPPTETTSLLPN